VFRILPVFSLSLAHYRIITHESWLKSRKTGRATRSSLVQA